ncbi:MAG TPA: propionyl-CoA--succinate CoA transferase, partial [Acidimicrobiales bacterium]|nr:propionyl-CoA--succinate CoA transferase [Acidimicrobiales bacterium]
MNEPEDVLDHIPEGADVIVPIGAGEPVRLLDTLEANIDRLHGVRIHRMDPYRERPYIRGEFGDRLRHVDYFLGPGSREAFWAGQCDLVPAHFSEVAQLLRNTTNCSIALATVSPPDRHGYVSLGTNADYTASFIGDIPFFLE